MSDQPALERTIAKVLSQAEDEMIAAIDSACDQAISKLQSSRGSVEAEYSRIIEVARKQAENLKRQIVGSSTLAARNKQLVMLEEAINDAFAKARTKIETARSSDKYISMMKRLLEDAINAVGGDAIVECNEKDRAVVSKLIPEVKKSKVRLSDEPISCLGGLKVRSVDGTMVYDNTLDSRIEHMKPLIKKDIARLFMS